MGVWLLLLTCLRCPKMWRENEVRRNLVRERHWWSLWEFSYDRPLTMICLLGRAKGIKVHSIQVKKPLVEKLVDIFFFWKKKRIFKKGPKKSIASLDADEHDRRCFFKRRPSFFHGIHFLKLGRLNLQVVDLEWSFNPLMVQLCWWWVGKEDFGKYLKIDPGYKLYVCLWAYPNLHTYRHTKS